MGVVNQAVVYGALVLSCIFLPKVILKFLGYKWTIPVMFIGYITWLAANGYVIVAFSITISKLVQNQQHFDDFYPNSLPNQ